MRRIAIMFLVLGGTALAKVPPSNRPVSPERRAKPHRIDSDPIAPPAPRPEPAAAPAAPVPPANPAEEPIGGRDAVLTKCKGRLVEGRLYKWDLAPEIDLQKLVEWASPVLCHPIIVPQNLRQQKVNLIAPGPVYPEEMRRLFFAALNAMGVTVQPQGPKGRELYTIIEAQRAHELPVPLLGPDHPTPSNESYVTKLIRLQHVTPDELMPLLGRIKSKDGDIVAFAPTGMLIVTDSSENIRRMEELLKQLDIQPQGGEKIWVVKLVNTGAAEMSQILEKVFQPKAAGPGAHRPNLAGGTERMLSRIPREPIGGVTPPEGESPSGGGVITVSQIIPEDRSNTLIIVATEKAYQHILGLINRLDQTGGPLDSAADRLHVYPLANANAEDMASTLSSLGISVTRGRSAGGRGGAPAASGPSGGAPALFEGEVKVSSDKATNSLVIVASGKDYFTLRDLIRKLDVARRQVFIEATILEVSLDKARKLGVAAHGGGNLFGGSPNQSLLFGGVEPNSATNSLLFSPAALSGLAAGLRGPEIPNAATTLGLPAGTPVPSFGVFVQALQNNNDVNVMSMPHVLTTDNEKAIIKVGRNLPFPGSLGGGFPGLPGATGATPGVPSFGFGTSVQRQDVALSLELTPHVNDSDFVRLEIDAEISDVASENFNGLGPATDKRTAKTVVVVRDQQPVVIGGLVKDRVSEIVDKVPLLGDIPLLGYLFKFTRKSISKQNLLIILTPYVIKDPSDLRRIFERKIRERREFLDYYSAFNDTRSYEPVVDFRHKRGLLEEINRSAVEAERDAADLRAAESQVRVRRFEGPVEPMPLPPRSPPPPPPVTVPLVPAPDLKEPQ